VTDYGEDDRHLALTLGIISGIPLRVLAKDRCGTLRNL
jgi:hypothetical protein